MATVQQMQCDLCERQFPNDGSVRKIRFALDGPIVRTRQQLGKPEDKQTIEASAIDHDQDFGIEDACEECRDAIRKALLALKTRTLVKQSTAPQATFKTPTKPQKAKTRG